MNSPVTTWVIDANIAIWAFVPSLGREQAAALLERADVLVVPALWVYEVTSALRKILRLRPIPEETVEGLVMDVLRLPDEIFPPDTALALSALAWAARLEQNKAYDAFYLALAERLGAEFWTADQRLFHRARQAGADFVRLLGERRG